MGVLDMLWCVMAVLEMAFLEMAGGGKVLRNEWRGEKSMNVQVVFGLGVRK